MARGRGGSVPSGGVTKKRVIYLDDTGLLDSPSVIRKSERISRHTQDDADQLSRKSRTRDKQLLDDIQQKLILSTYVNPFRRAASLVPRPRAEGALFIIAGSDPPPLRPMLEEEKFYKATTVPAYRAPRVIHRPKISETSVRARSEPPPLQTYYRMPVRNNLRTKPSVVYYPDLGHTSPTIYYHHDVVTPKSPAIYYHPHLGPTIVSSERRNGPKTSPSHELAIRNARMYLGRVERELGMYGDGPTFEEPVIYQSKAPVASHVRVHRVAQPHYPPATSHYAVPGGHVPMHVPASRVRVTASPARVVPLHSGVSYRSASLPPPSPGTTRRSRIPDIETRIEAQVFPDLPMYTFSTLRARANNARDKMDAHKVLLDRYLPIYMGPENEVEYEVDAKYNELLQRIPSLEPYKPNPGYYGTDNNVPLHKPPPMPKRSPGGGGGHHSSDYGAPLRTSYAPPVSATRKRLRDVICATRHDPTYFN